MKNSRAKGKFDVRLRKRTKLDEKHELRSKKYDAAMVHTLMSEDEDSIKDGQVIKTEYISRPPVYRSIEFYDLLDKLPDPTPSHKYIKRVVGVPKEIPPPIAKKLENRARRWMISPEWLAKPENKEYDVPQRISESGVAWGDEKDPEEIEATQQRVKEEKADIKRQKTGSGKKETAKAKKGKGKGKEKAVSKQPVVSSSSVGSADDMYV
ncbi:hypothetical protein CVT25_011630 [Psilocybe cyanescens]|uniref:Uncharacterized protein n=1 Tax=Psilocybe cyanescens TaxID=93625 RepID=A0A409WIL2_PSICY|nr:hypothetical protein CVT25_011630 [Psilocybe cyanescens]